MDNPKGTIASIDRVLLARNTVLNFLAQIAPFIAAIFTIPPIITGLGIERFGILSIAWATLGYLTVFDLGLGRAATKFVAEALGRGKEKEIPQMVWSAVIVQIVFGFIGALILFASTPFIITHVFKIPAALAAEAGPTFYILALAIPVTFVSSSFSGALEAAQRFDLISAVKIPTSIAMFLLPFLGLLLGLHLPGIVALILAARSAALGVFIAFYLKIFPDQGYDRFSPVVLRKLLSFGGWVTASNFIIPVFVYMDRFLIGALLSMGALAYYTAPYEVVTRFLIIPASLVAVVFPAFSSFASEEGREKLEATFARSVKYVIVIMTFVTVIFLLYSNAILTLWLGESFAAESARVLQILSVAVALNAIGFIPFGLIQGIGRPDMIAKYHLVELPVYAAVSFFFIRRFGIEGAALAWFLRMCWSMPIFFLLVTRIAKISIGSLARYRVNIIFAITAGVIVSAAVFSAIPAAKGALASACAAGLALIGYGILVWRYAFDGVDRRLIKDLINHRGLLWPR